ncbi:MAG: hypothetical protein WBM00_09955 [Solirubrobacterales bacterium]
MTASRSDCTGEWTLPDDARPPLIGELVARIDEAVATARASEAAVMTVGAAALDAAEQARRAAELAERASAAMLRDRQGDEDGSLRDFSIHADRVAARLRALERAPISVRRTNGGAALERQAV